MKSSPLIDFSFSAISSGIIASLFYLKPTFFELIVIVVPLVLSAIFIVVRYAAAFLQISDYETFAMVRKLKKRKKHLQVCLEDAHISSAKKQEHQQEYEKVNCAIDELLKR